MKINFLRNGVVSFFVKNITCGGALCAIKPFYHKFPLLWYIFIRLMWRNPAPSFLGCSLQTLCRQTAPTKFPQNSQKGGKARLSFLYQITLCQTAGGVGDEYANSRKL